MFVPLNQRHTIYADPYKPLTQIESAKGNIQKSIQIHLEIIERAIQLNSDLIVFPELSITGYEPELAKELSTSVENEIFNPFQEISDNNEITIGIGMPTKAVDGINISMLIFRPNEKDRLVYSKCILHSDELPFFVSSNSQPSLKIKGRTISFGICYETLQREHFVKAKEKDAEIYIASVAKSDRGTNKAYLHFPSIAKEFNTPILMSNTIGYCDNFLSNGSSAVWNEKGQLIGQLDNKNQGILIYDTETRKVEVGR